MLCIRNLQLFFKPRNNSISEPFLIQLGLDKWERYSVNVVEEDSNEVERIRLNCLSFVSWLLYDGEEVIKHLGGVCNCYSEETFHSVSLWCV